MDPHNAEDARLVQLCRAAFHAEHQRLFADAQRMHHEAVSGLNKLVDDAGWRDRDRKRVARKQIKFHSARAQVLAPIIDGRKDGLEVVLPTSLSMHESLSAVAPNGRMSIAREEIWLASYHTKKAENPNHPVDPRFQHLLQSPVTPYTPTIDASLPNVTYHIHSSADTIFPFGHVFYYKAKTATPEHETLYVLQAPKRLRLQIPLATLHRASEFATPCVKVQIQPVAPSQTAMLNGRSLTMYGSSTRPIVEKPDRVERQWGYRRFHYAGREFVWETDKRNSYMPDTLYEVESSWPKVGSKTGKKEHKVVGRKLVWGESKIRIKKKGIIHMVGGLDQVFVEHILASQLARLAVVIHGHQ